MKQGWTYKKVGDVFKTYSGGTPIKSHKEYYENGDIPWIRSGEVCRKYITESEMFITRAGLENSSAKFFPVDTVLVAMYGATAAQVGILKIRATSNQAVCGILPNENFIPEFVYYWFKLIESDLASQAQGGAQPNISQEKIKKVEIPIISLSEQERIVERLDAAFAQIDELKSNAEKQLAEARALFQSALTQAMQPKPGWQEFKIMEIGEVIGGTTPNTSNPNYWGGDNCWISPAELHGEKYLYDSVKKITEEAVIAKNLKLLPEGTVILSSRAPIGKVAINKVPMYCNQGFKCIVCGPKIFNEFLYWWLWGNTDYLNSIGSGATFAEISKTVVQNISIRIPSKPEQEIIAAHLDRYYSFVHRLEHIQNEITAECDALKQALLRQIFE